MHSYLPTLRGLIVLVLIGFACSSTHATEPYSMSGLRGVMLGPPLQLPRLSQCDVTKLHHWNVNVVRWQLNNPAADTQSEAEYMAWIDQSLHEIDLALPMFREAGIKIVIDLHTPPGRRHQDITCNPPRTYGAAMFYDVAGWERAAFKRVWQTIAARYANERAIVGYDLLNEPETPQRCDGRFEDSGKVQWRLLAIETAQLIRQVDTRHAIIFEPSGGSPQQLRSDYFPPLPVPGVIYSVHVYAPLDITHQCTGSFDLPGCVPSSAYPGMVDNTLWNRTELRNHLQQVINYKNTNGVEIFIGEFSCTNKAPGLSAGYYIRDCIQVFEEQGFSWTYHAYAEADVWNVEKSTVGDPCSTISGPCDNGSVDSYRKQKLLEKLDLNPDRRVRLPFRPVWVQERQRR